MLNFSKVREEEILELAPKPKNETQTQQMNLLTDKASQEYVVEKLNDLKAEGEHSQERLPRKISLPAIEEAESIISEKIVPVVQQVVHQEAFDLDIESSIKEDPKQYQEQRMDHLDEEDLMMKKAQEF